MNHSQRTYGNRNANEFPSLQCRTGFGHEVSEENANNHGKEDPEGEELIKES